MFEKLKTMTGVTNLSIRFFRVRKETEEVSLDELGVVEFVNSIKPPMFNENGGRCVVSFNFGIHQFRGESKLPNNVPFDMIVLTDAAITDAISDISIKREEIAALKLVRDAYLKLNEAAISIRNHLV